jgi:hypothetical protein
VRASVALGCDGCDGCDPGEGGSGGLWRKYEYPTALPACLPASCHMQCSDCHSVHLLL